MVTQGSKNCVGHLRPKCKVLQLHVVSLSHQPDWMERGHCVFWFSLEKGLGDGSGQEQGENTLGVVRASKGEATAVPADTVSA